METTSPMKIDDDAKDTMIQKVVCDCRAEQIRLDEAFCLTVPLLLMLVFDAQRQRCFQKASEISKVPSNDPSHAQR